MYFFDSKYFFYDFNPDFSQECFRRFPADQNEHVMVRQFEHLIAGHNLNAMRQNASHLRSTHDVDTALLFGFVEHFTISLARAIECSAAVGERHAISRGL